MKIMLTCSPAYTQCVLLRSHEQDQAGTWNTIIESYTPAEGYVN